MRKFSELEKRLITRMIELDDDTDSLTVLGNMMEFYLPDYCYIEVKSQNNISIQIKKELEQKLTADCLRKIDKDITKNLLSIVALFEYLETEKLAYFVGDLNFNTLGIFFDGIEYIKCEFLDNDLKPVIYKYTRKKIFVSETLRVIEQNGFKTDEEIIHEKELSSVNRQLKLTYCALFLTLVGLIFSSSLPFWVVSPIDVKNDLVVIELNENTIIKIQQSITEIINQLFAELVNTKQETKEILLNEHDSDGDVGQ
ncbi:hypothetical protein [Nitrosomonas sp.]|uniref:hypothetical protein n=1 Tax=Nitrosomonas sp. TaxID=42353 RepID=UPI0025D84319|nr:hypothetical protein [Nitrosomonas sp.]